MSVSIYISGTPNSYLSLIIDTVFLSPRSFLSPQCKVLHKAYDSESATYVFKWAFGTGACIGHLCALKFCKRKWKGPAALIGKHERLLWAQEVGSRLQERESPNCKGEFYFFNDGRKAQYFHSFWKSQ